MGFHIGIVNLSIHRMEDGCTREFVFMQTQCRFMLRFGNCGVTGRNLFCLGHKIANIVFLPSLMVSAGNTHPDCRIADFVKVSTNPGVRLVFSAITGIKDRPAGKSCRNVR
jgi:hypothetical protein